MASHWPPTFKNWSTVLWQSTAMNKEKIETIATKFSEKFPISMLKKHRIINGPNWNIMVQLIFNNFCFRPSKTNKRLDKTTLTILRIIFSRVSFNFLKELKILIFFEIYWPLQCTKSLFDREPLAVLYLSSAISFNHHFDISWSV